MAGQIGPKCSPHTPPPTWFLCFDASLILARLAEPRQSEFPFGCVLKEDAVSMANSVRELQARELAEKYPTLEEAKARLGG